VLNSQGFLHLPATLCADIFTDMWSLCFYSSWSPKTCFGRCQSWKTQVLVSSLLSHYLQSYI